ncbi:helix-turn-helix transcriptional regulator [Leifsonia sp. F6_8S_P_1B]|uniref:Helix-turn-helix transcriptional regulator n=1 Tax=Leifsonia williamsii TaxID=3035919 RepID=A0ABT8KEY2_9MICO|nr:helix-turn-helix transcriptional regulator [Leifsonia williamsii]MDN4616010.1 helix-turn-helix transcriptional regulator [Leifsonia williamsii]
MVEQDPVLSIELAAADSQLKAHVLLAKAFAARADLSQRDLAEKLRVSEGRVSQILGGDDDLRVSTLGRYLRALGYDWDAELVSKEQEAPEVGTASRNQSEFINSDVYIGVAVRGEERVPSFTFVPEGFAPNAPEGQFHAASITAKRIPHARLKWTPLTQGDTDDD